MNQMLAKVGEGEGNIRINMNYVYVTTHHNECNHYVPQTCTNKNCFNFKNRNSVRHATL